MAVRQVSKTPVLLTALLLMVIGSLIVVSEREQASSATSLSSTSTQPPPPDPEDFPPPNANDEVIRLDDSDLAPPPAARPSTEALNEIADAERRRRLRSAAASLEAQRNALLQKSQGALTPLGLRVVSTLGEPISLEQYRAQLSAYDLTLDDDTVVFAYTELSDGYPITVWGPPDQDFRMTINEVIDSLGAALPRPREPGEPTMVRILGFNSPYETFIAQEAELTTTFGIAAREVVQGRDARPMILTQ